MLAKIVSLSLRYPRLVALGAALTIFYGGLLLSHARFEVFPEFVPAQASVQVEAPGFTASQVELLITQPIEQSINGATGVATVRSKSIQGLSVIDVTFRAGESPYQARQVVAERIAQATARLPAGIGAPTLSPLTSSTMDLLKIGLVSEKLSPAELRDYAQWTLKPRLLSTAGVARINIFGGDLDRIEIRTRIADLIARNLTLRDVTTAVQSATLIRGGGYADTSSQRILIEPRGSAFAASDLATAVVAPSTASPVRLSDVADVLNAASPKFGDALVMGRPGVLLALSTQYGANTLTVTRDVEAALAELSPSMEAKGIAVYPALHRPANFIETALEGVRNDLLIGAFLIFIVLSAFTRDWRIALVAFVSIPFSLLAAIIVFDIFGTTVNTMILGGLAVALGVVIDDAVIGAENILRRLREHRTRDVRDVILDAVIEVRAPVVYATLILTLTMAPVLFLSGLQGAFFSPLALSFVLAIFASLIVAVTLTPALALLLLGKTTAPQEPKFIHAIKSIHGRQIERIMERPKECLAATLTLSVLALGAFAAFGGELLPAFRERHYVLSVAGPSGASIEWMKSVGVRMSSDLLAIPGIATVEQQIGRAEAGEDTFPPNASEYHVELDKVSGTGEERILRDIRAVLASYRGLETEALTFLGDRIGESLSGETAAIAISAYGPDLNELDRVAASIAEAMKGVPGAVDVRVQTPPGLPIMALELDSQKLALRGVSAGDAYEAIGAASQGLFVTQVADGQRVIDVVVTAPAQNVRDPEDIGAVPVRGPDGAMASITDVANVFLTTNRATISHDGGRRRQVITANASTRDVVGLSSAIRAAIAAKVKLPSGVYLGYSGVAEGQAAAQQELLTNVAMAGIGIMVVLVVAFGGGRPAILIISSAPSALVGGVLVVAISGSVVSLGSLVGFVTLFGVAARNAILLVAHTDYLVSEEGAPWTPATIIRATSERLTPILMTALVTALGMLPLALGSGEAGREVQGPMASVILGGLFTSTAMTLILLPPLIYAYRWAPALRPPAHSPSPVEAT
ncbi:MAG: efflux RND transporter permease subunit [Rhodospirillaceae bacterium]|nr:efflux RND transporter permease subunit [Rhodospirillaceae bacterium]